jgi:hypothetical protein
MFTGSKLNLYTFQFKNTESCGNLGDYGGVKDPGGRDFKSSQTTTNVSETRELVSLANKGRKEEQLGRVQLFLHSW